MASTLTATDVISEYGAYYINSGQNSSRVLTLLKQQSLTAKLAKRIISSDTNYRMSKATINEVVQGFHKTWSPKGDVDFDPRTIIQRRMKIDWEGEPDELVESWLGFQADLSKNDRTKWPFVRWMLEVLLVPQAEQDRELSVYWGGEYSAAAGGGVANNASDTMDGIKKLIDDGITDGTVNEVELSAAPTPSNIFDLIEEFSDAIPDKYDAVPMMMGLSGSWRRKYFRDKRNSHGGNVDYTPADDAVDYRENLKLTGLPSMNGSDYIWATPLSNFLHVSHQSTQKKYKMFEIEKIDRKIKVYTDWYEGLGFGINEHVFAYQPDAGSSSSASSS